MTRTLSLAGAAALVLCLACDSPGLDGSVGKLADPGGAAPRLAESRDAPEDATAVELASLRDRVLIRSAELRVEVDDVPTALDAAQTIAAAHGGIVSDSRLTGGASGGREATFTVRVPADAFEDAVAELGTLGEVTSETTATEDVTMAYADLETRLAVARDTADRLRRILMERTGSVADVLQVERELARVVERIESMEGQRRYYARQAAVSSIRVDVREPVAPDAEPVLAPIGRAFSDSLDALVRSVSVMVYLVVFVAPWLVVAVVVWWLVAQVRRRPRGNSGFPQAPPMAPPAR